MTEQSSTFLPITTAAVTDEEVSGLFDAIYRDEWPVIAVRIAATVRGLRTIAEAAQECVAMLSAQSNPIRDGGSSALVDSVYRLAQLLPQDLEPQS